MLFKSNTPMKASRFEVHTHTMYSNLKLLDCINRPEKLIDRAIEIGLKGIAITDHDCLSSHVKVNKYAQNLYESNPDFKVALGNEIYLCPDRSMGQKYYHFILIAKNAQGHKALRELSSRAWMNSYYDRGIERVVTTYQDLVEIYQKYPNSLIGTTACLGGELSTQTLKLIQSEKVMDAQGREDAHKDIVDFIFFCKNLFGNDFYIEVAPGCSKDQIQVNQRLASIAKCFDLKIVIGCDSHYLKKEDRYVHKAYLNSKDGEREVDAFYEYAYLQEEEEVIKNLSVSFSEQEIEQMFINSMDIYDKITNYSLYHSQQIPKVEVEDYPPCAWWGVNNDYADEMSTYPVLKSMFTSKDKIERYWINQCWDKLKEEGKINDFKYLQALEEEARVKRVIGEKLETNMFQYPVTLQHYIDLIWKCGSPVGAGRGSACAALNHYLLGVTQLDPVEWNLPFFRYLNEERTELGDVDIDVASSRRPTIIKEIKKERKAYIKDSYDDLTRNNLGCTLVATFGTESTKSTILTACFIENTKVKTLTGEKNIQDISNQDYVLTTNGWEKVIAPTEYIWKGNFVEIDGNHGFEDTITATDNHEFLVLPKTNNHRLKGDINHKVINSLIPTYSQLTESKKCKYRNYIRNISPVWIEGKDLKEKDYLLNKIDDTLEDIDSMSWVKRTKSNTNLIKNKIIINNDFCELLGLWLAEGSLNRDMYSFTISSKEEELKDRIIYLVNNVFGLTNPYVNYRDNNSIVIQYSSADLRDFLYDLFEIQNFSEINQYNKYIPKKLLYISPQKQLQIFKGWIIGDGYYRERTHQQWSGSKEVKGTTVSRQLFLDMKHILYRNFLNPSIIKERREGKADVYNILLSGKVAQKIGQIKYTNYSNELNIEWEDRLGKDLPCVYNNNLYMRCQITKIKTIENQQNKKVYCLMVPSQNFSVSGVIVHNCRGYRSGEYPDGIDVDTAQYLSSLVPQERGFLWSLEDMLYGNKEKGRKPIKMFITEVEEYPGLIEIMLGIQNLVNKRSSHASGVIMFDEDPYEFGCFMRTPKGEIITQYDLHDAEYVGMTKYDILITEIQDKILETIKMLQEDNQIEKDLTLREVYNKYLRPNVLPIESEKVWDNICNNKVLNLFQFDSDVGSQAAKKIRPRNIIELCDSNGLMRLMTQEKGEETPMEKYIRFKNDISLWYKEMDDYGLTKEEQKILEPYFLKSYGVPPSQEQMMTMLMDTNICGFTLAEANTARKIVAKKQTSKIPELHQQILNQATRKKLGEYVWQYGIGPQVGYSFSIVHSLAYSFIGFQTAYLATNWNAIYWNTACLIVNSGSTETEEDFEELKTEGKKKEKATDYAKIAKALGEILSRGIKVSLVDINKSDITFKPDVEKNEILFGMKALSGINAETVEQIKRGRPYKSFKDFLSRCPLNKTSMISLIKSGAFDSLEQEWAKELKIEPRILIMIYYLSKVCEPKTKLNLQNFNGLLNSGLIPEELDFQKKVFHFNKYIKANKANKYYLLDNTAYQFYSENFPIEDLEVIQGYTCINQKTWDKKYQKAMDAARDWLKNNQSEILKEYNILLFSDYWKKYATGTISSWEMESLCFYYHDHELINVNKYKYGLTTFSELSPEPEIDYYYKRKEKNIPIYKIHKIIGTVISKNDARSSISLLTPDGDVVNVKFTKEYYAMFGRQISEKNDDGTKSVKEKSWFTRGTKLLICGFRRDDMFISKTYKNTNSHQLYKITEVYDDGTIELTHERYEPKVNN